MQGVCLRHCMHYVSKQSQANRPRDRPRAASFPAYSSLAAFFNPRTTWSLFHQFLQSHGLCELLLPQLDLPLSRRVSRRVSLRGLQRFPPQLVHDALHSQGLKRPWQVPKRSIAVEAARCHLKVQFPRSSLLVVRISPISFAIPTFGTDQGRRSCSFPSTMYITYIIHTYIQTYNHTCTYIP